MLNKAAGVLAITFGVVAALGEFAQIGLFMYADWLYIGESFWNLINPLVLLAVIWDLLHMPAFWVCFAITVVSGALYLLSLSLLAKLEAKEASSPWSSSDINDASNDNWQKLKGILGRVLGCAGACVILVLLMSAGIWAYTALQERQARKDMSEFTDSYIQSMTDNLELYPENAEIYLSRGSAYYSEADYESAISDFTKAVQLQPSDAEAYVLRCRAYRKLGKHEEIIQDCNKLLEVAPSHAAFAYYHRGLTYFMMDQLELAAHDFTDGLAAECPLDLVSGAEKNPAAELEAQLYFFRGEIYARQGKWTAAESDWNNALAQDISEHGELSQWVRDRLDWLGRQGTAGGASGLPTNNASGDGGVE